MLTPEDMPALSRKIAALYFGGVSLACEPGVDAYAAPIEQVHEDRVILIDPNIRPSFITDDDRHRARLEGMIAKADIVKISDEDLNWMVPDDASTEDKAKTLLRYAPRIVILTHGGDGATGYLQDGTEVQICAETVEVVDTVGAGDKFNAGLLSAISDEGLPTKKRLNSITPIQLEAALTFGARVAAVTVSRAAANPPWLEKRST
jgi:fructokinase